MEERWLKVKNSKQLTFCFCSGMGWQLPSSSVASDPRFFFVFLTLPQDARSRILSSSLESLPLCLKKTVGSGDFVG